jgi:glycosyltransferase involved in cell wall biosynthesis
VFFDYIIPFVFFAAICIQLIYILFVFTKLLFHTDNEIETNNTKYPGVSIILAAWNELPNLKELLPILDNQDYPNFEIVIADDRSEDGTYDYLRTNEGNFKNLNTLRIQEVPGHFTAKKYAVTMAIKKSTKDILLLTDADCRPNSDQWIKNMVCQMYDDKKIVLGISPYYYKKSFLNTFIRFETFQTALQYLSFALAKMPYMGVGRNLMYKKDLFWKSNGFARHYGLLSGDDDLFINEVSEKNNVSICINEDGQVFSEPKETWNDWIIQKKRHLSVGKKYRLKDKINLGLLWFGQIVSWFWVIPAFFANPKWFYAPEWSRISEDWLNKELHIGHWYPYNDWMRLISGVFLIWILIKWIVLAKANKKIGNMINPWKIPAFDFAYAIYLFIFGIITAVSKPQKIKWR